MKKYLIGIVALCMMLLVSVSFAGLDVSGETYTTIAVSTACTNGATTTDAVDVSTLKGIGKIILFDSGDIGLASTQQVVTVQHSVTGTSAWTNVTAPAFADTSTNATIEAESIDTQTLHKYIRLSVTVNGTGLVTHYVGASIVTSR